MRFAKNTEHDTSEVLRLPREMTFEVSKVLRLPRHMQRIFWKRRKSIAPATQALSTRFETRWNVTKCHACHANWGYATLETSKSDPFGRTCHRHGHTALTRTVADGCERLRTVAQRLANTAQPPHPQSETGTLATHSGKIIQSPLNLTWFNQPNRNPPTHRSTIRSPWYPGDIQPTECNSLANVVFRQAHGTTKETHEFMAKHLAIHWNPFPLQMDHGNWRIFRGLANLRRAMKIWDQWPPQRLPAFGLNDPGLVWSVSPGRIPTAIFAAQTGGHVLENGCVDHAAWRMVLLGYGVKFITQQTTIFGTCCYQTRVSSIPISKLWPQMGVS